MPWTPQHKEETRRRILDAAAAAFRTHGADGIALADIMREVGLTHGGFYAHFASKEELLAATLAEVNASRIARFEAMAKAAPAGSALQAAADVYLSSRHREHPESGCFVATLGSEVARSDGPARQRMSFNIHAWLDQFARCAPGTHAESRRQAATGAFAAMIGGIIMARGVVESNESDRILADVRAFIRDALAQAGSPPEPGARPQA